MSKRQLVLLPTNLQNKPKHSSFTKRRNPSLFKTYGLFPEVEVSLLKKLTPKNFDGTIKIIVIKSKKNNRSKQRLPQTDEPYESREQTRQLNRMRKVQQSTMVNF